MVLMNASQFAPDMEMDNGDYHGMVPHDVDKYEGGSGQLTDDELAMLDKSQGGLGASQKPIRNPELSKPANKAGLLVKLNIQSAVELKDRTGDDAIKESPEIIQDLLREKEFMIFAADAKSGKTWLGLMLAHAISSGKDGSDWLGKKILTHGPVIYFNFELAETTFKIRMQMVCDANGGVYPKDLHYVSLRGSVSPSVSALAEQLQAQIGSSGGILPPKVIIFDSLYNTYGSLDENSNSEMAAHMQSIISITEKIGCAVVFLHHFNKSSGYALNDSARASGAHALHRAPDALITGTILGVRDEKKMGMRLMRDHIQMRITPSVRSFKDSDSFTIVKPKGAWQYRVMSASEVENAKLEKKKYDNEAGLKSSDLPKFKKASRVTAMDVVKGCFSAGESLGFKDVMSTISGGDHNGRFSEKTIRSVLEKAAKPGGWLVRDGQGVYKLPM